MSSDDADPELLELLRQTLLGPVQPKRNAISSHTGVLRDAEFTYSNAIDVSVDMYGTKSAAASIHKSMHERGYSTEAWAEHELHPKLSDGFTEIELVNFIFTMDLLNFSFWSELPETTRFQVEYNGTRWTGYSSLLACLRRALAEHIPITNPTFWRSARATDETYQQVFRSATDEQMPLLDQRIEVLKEAADVLQSLASHVEPSTDELFGIAHDDSLSLPAIPRGSTDDEVLSASARNREIAPEDVALPDSDSESDLEQTMTVGKVFDGKVLTAHENAPFLKPDLSVIRMIEKADRSAGKLVNLLAEYFACFRDEARYEGRKVRFLKRAQIFVADLWAAFSGKGYGEFSDIEELTMFPDYRVPQMLHTMGVLTFSPPLQYHINGLRPITPGHTWEIQLRGCSIWAVEMIRREIERSHPEVKPNAILIDFFLYDLAKQREKLQSLSTPHHRTRSIWY